MAISTYSFNSEILFYSTDFMIFNGTAMGPEECPFIYVKPDSKMQVNEQYFNKEKIFTNLWLYDFGKSNELYDLSVNSIYLKYSYCILMLNSRLDLGYNRFLTQYNTAYTLYMTPSIPNFKIIECRNLIGLQKFTGSKTMKRQNIQVINGINSGKEIMGLIIEGDLYKNFKAYLDHKIQ